MDTHYRPRHPCARALSVWSSSASGLSPQLADAPPGLVPLGLQAGEMTGIDPNVLLAIAKVETDWGRARQGQSDDLVPVDLRAHVDPVALLGLPDVRRIGDWVNPQAVDTEQASSWRAKAAVRQRCGGLVRPVPRVGCGGHPVLLLAAALTIAPTSGDADPGRSRRARGA